ncbi:prepilin-type N-terminal cleavage/methylation domain-containing protein [Alteromonadaceae bacterium 2753L.S.0a.02]|nr:prepilin-type N-terminal cleavage/methylation domain-containing protein [Alteromonadaceae bacterium 2753L.S.0a.02]
MKQQGLSLIELMIVIAIFSLVSLASVSFTSAWVDGNRVLEGESLVFQAFSRAKATALRNEFASTGDQAAAAMCFSNNTLSVHAASDGAAATCAGSPSWSVNLHQRLELQANGAALSCACLSNQGRLTQTGCATCTSASSIRLISGDENADVSLF